MKRRDLIRHLERHGYLFRREGTNHTVFINPIARKCSTIPRHREILDRKSTRLNSSHIPLSRMPSSA